MQISARFWRLCALLALASGVAVSAAAAIDARARQGIVEVGLENGLLTVEARDVPLVEVVTAIGDRAGFETLVLGDVDIRVNASFSDLPINEALDQVLGRSNRVIVYAPPDEHSPKQSVVRLWLLGSGAATDDAMTGETPAPPADPLQSADPKTRSEAVLRLGAGVATEAELEALADALQNDEQSLVRTRAAIALGALRDERAVSALEVALLDDSPSVRIQAIHALSKIGGERATSALGDVLLHGTDPQQRLVAAQGLAALGTALARQYLDAVSEDPDDDVRAASRGVGKRHLSPASGSRRASDQVGARMTE